MLVYRNKFTEKKQQRILLINFVVSIIELGWGIFVFYSANETKWVSQIVSITTFILLVSRIHFWFCSHFNDILMTF